MVNLAIVMMNLINLRKRLGVRDIVTVGEWEDTHRLLHTQLFSIQALGILQKTMLSWSG